MAASEPAGDVYRLYLENAEQKEKMKELEKEMFQMSERLSDLTSRVVRFGAGKGQQRAGGHGRRKNREH